MDVSTHLDGGVVAGHAVWWHDHAPAVVRYATLQPVPRIPVAITTETKPVNGFVGFATRLPRSTTYGTLSITDPLTGITSENNVGY